MTVAQENKHALPYGPQVLSGSLPAHVMQLLWQIFDKFL
jgi:hypothetical protein